MTVAGRSGGWGLLGPQLAAAAMLLPGPPAWPDDPALAAESSTPAAEAPPAPDGQPAPAETPAASTPARTPPGWTRWFDPATAPFIPVPEIAVDPNSGTTLGLIPTWLHSDEREEIDRIIAPDVLHNPFFGYGGHFRIYAYPSTDQQWSLVTDVMERVERGLDFEWQNGRDRLQHWSINSSVIYDRDGSPRFYGIGNNSPAIAETNYTLQEELLQVQLGYNLTHTWQLQYTWRTISADVLPGTLAGIASIQHRFAGLLGIGTNSELLDRVSLVYDTRDDLTVPSRGMAWYVYGGVAGQHAFFDDSLFKETGFDGRAFFPVTRDLVVASHVALRYLIDANAVPFWALSSIGGGTSVVGGEQPLRGYGEGRYYDRDSFSASVELRQRAFSFDAVTTAVDVQVTPFMDLGRVFPRAGISPISQLHAVGGVGFRGVARPFVVGYVDIGYGNEGVAVFTGINYPF